MGVTPHPLSCIALALLLCGALEAAPGLAQSRLTAHTLRLDHPDARPPASIDEVAWIAGHWAGPAFGGTGEEVWSRPAARAMMGMFRLIRGDSLVFYELLTLAEAEGSLVLRLKHFNPDLVGWEGREEVITFPLVHLAPDTAFFDGMTFVRAGPDALTVALVTDPGTPPSETLFRYTRVATVRNDQRP